MNILNMAGIVVATAAMTAPLTGFAAPTDHSQDRKVTVIGCAVHGDGGDDGFLLVNNVERTTVAALSPTPTGVEVNSVTTSALKPAHVLYWLDDDDHAVQRLMGQIVEVTGEVEGDIELGNIKAERENGMIELEIDADGHKATVKVPEVPSAMGSERAVTDQEKKLPYVVQKLDVKSARSIAPTCRQ